MNRDGSQRMSDPTPDPEFTIVIPTRNRPADFERALQSVLAQTCRSFEVVVVNDGSDDQHRAAYQRIEAASPPNVRYLQLMQRARGHGHCFARNQAVDVARGRFIGFLDDDDLWTDPEFLARAQAALQRHGGDFYLANQNALTHDGRPVNNLWLNGLGPRLPASVRTPGGVYPVTIDQLLLADGFGHMNCWAIRRTLFLAAGGMDENLRYEPDLDIYMRALDKARRVLHDEQVVAMHHIPDPQKSVNASTANGRLQKLLFQLNTVNKHVLHLTHPALLRRARQRHGYLLKNLSEALAGLQRHSEAAYYARQALAVLPTAGWLLRTLQLGLRALGAQPSGVAGSGGSPGR